MLGSRALVRASLLSSPASPKQAAGFSHGRPPSNNLAQLSTSDFFPRLLSNGRGKRSSCNSSFSETDHLDEVSSEFTVEELLAKSDRVNRLMKMERSPDVGKGSRWFPYLDSYQARTGSVSSREIVELIDPHIMEPRKERMKKVVAGRSFSICLVIEGLTDYGNVSAAFRSADALGIQSVHVISNVKSRRYRDNRHVSMGAEKWLDIELWSSVAECFKVLKSRGYRIASTHLGPTSASVYDMDWSIPTAIVIGNEHMGISKEALEYSDLHCAVPMNGMVDSFNVSVAAGILLHYAVCDKISRLGYYGDLTSKEREIMLAEFFLRNRESAVDVVDQYASQRQNLPISRI